MSRNLRKFNAMFQTKNGSTFAPGEVVRIEHSDWRGIEITIHCENGHSEVVNKADFWNATFPIIRSHR